MRGFRCSAGRASGLLLFSSGYPILISDRLLRWMQYVEVTSRAVVCFESGDTSEMIALFTPDYADGDEISARDLFTMVKATIS